MREAQGTFQKWKKSTQHRDLALSRGSTFLGLSTTWFMGRCEDTPFMSTGHFEVWEQLPAQVWHASSYRLWKYGLNVAGGATKDSDFYENLGCWCNVDHSDWDWPNARETTEFTTIVNLGRSGVLRTKEEPWELTDVESWLSRNTWCWMSMSPVNVYETRRSTNTRLRQPPSGLVKFPRGSKVTRGREMTIWHETLARASYYPTMRNW